MFSNITSSQALPLAIRVSSQPTRFCKHFFINFTKTSHKSFDFLKPAKFSNGFYNKSIEMSTRSISSSIGARSFSSSYSLRGSEGSRVLKGAKSLPLLKSKKAKQSKLKKVISSNASRSSWEESAERLEKVKSTKIDLSSWKESAGTFVGNKESRNEGVDTLKNRENGYIQSNESVEKMSNSHTSWEESAKKLDNVRTTKIDLSSWRESAETFVGNEESRDVRRNRQNGYIPSNGSVENEGGEEAGEAVDKPRWDKSKNRFRGGVRGGYEKAVRGGSEKPEYQRWNKQENYGSEKPEYQRWSKQENYVRKTWMIGEGLYGVGPVLAALSAGRREFNALYVQEGLSLSSNNRKRKDKKGFERVLKMAENIGLSIKETSKHELNLVAENRPHQGLVLDASPLEMVKIKELDPISTKEGQASLWVALDEVTDPHNLGAIIRSSYFFGASGVVLCAKNSAPLSGVVSKASAGSLEFMELRYCNNMMQFLASSAENGWRVLGGSVSSRAVALNEVVPGPPTILVLGSEGTGLRPLVERSCTQLVRIPGNIPVDVVDDMGADVNSGSSAEQFRSFMAVESLNVSVAAGVLLHHLIGHNHDNNCQGGDNSTDAID